GGRRGGGGGGRGGVDRGGDVGRREGRREHGGHDYGPDPDPPRAEHFGCADAPTRILRRTNLRLLTLGGHGSTASLPPDRVSRPRMGHAILPVMPAPPHLRRRGSPRDAVRASRAGSSPRTGRTGPASR